MYYKLDGSDAMGVFRWEFALDMLNTNISRLYGSSLLDDAQQKSPFTAVCVCDLL